MRLAEERWAMSSAEILHGAPPFSVIAFRGHNRLKRPGTRNAVAMAVTHTLGEVAQTKTVCSRVIRQSIACSRIKIIDDEQQSLLADLYRPYRYIPGRRAAKCSFLRRIGGNSRGLETHRGAQRRRGGQENSGAFAWNSPPCDR